MQQAVIWLMVLGVIYAAVAPYEGAMWTTRVRIQDDEDVISICQVSDPTPHDWAVLMGCAQCGMLTLKSANDNGISGYKKTWSTLAEAIPAMQLSSLVIDGYAINPSIAADIAAGVAVSPKLGTLGIYTAGLQDYDTRIIAQSLENSSLRNLVLLNNNISSVGLSWLVKAAANDPNTTLTLLDLSNNSIDDRGVVVVASLLNRTKLRSIILTKNEGISVIGLNSMSRALGGRTAPAGTSVKAAQEIIMPPDCPSDATKCSCMFSGHGKTDTTTPGMIAPECRTRCEVASAMGTYSYKGSTGWTRIAGPGDVTCRILGTLSTCMAVVRSEDVCTNPDAVFVVF